MKTYSQMQEKLKWYVGKYIDFDGYYGAQCADLAVDYVYWATDGKYRMWGNAVDAINNSFGKYATIYKNTPNFMPRVGDIAVWTQAPANPIYGHIGIVYGNVTLQSCTMLDQNWYNDSTQGAILRKDDYSGVTHFIRINFDGKEVTNQKVVSNAIKPIGRKNNWKKNQWGTWYLPENFSFTVGSVPIHARNGGPHFNNHSPGTVAPGTTIKYDEVCLSEGYVWIGYTLFDGTRQYLPIRTWNGVAPSNQGVGTLWGTIK